MWALIFAPFLFKWALSVYMRATPIQRGQSIGGGLHCNRNFVIQVIGAHHTGVLHEILNAIHGEGMDVLECRVETDGEVDTNYFVVQSRGEQKDFDDEKLQEVRHHIQEILGDVNAVVMFEAVDDDDFTFSAIELQVVTNSQPDAGTELTLSLTLTLTLALTLSLTLPLTLTLTLGGLPHLHGDTSPLGGLVQLPLSPGAISTGGSP